MYSKYKDPGAEFRTLLAREEGVFGFGVANAADALVASMTKTRVIYAGGWSIAGSKGRPDMGQVTMTEQRDQIREIVRSTPLPVIADIDDGYGDAKNVLRTAAEFFGTLEYDFNTRAVHRLAGVHIEDQVLPKRCGHIAGKKLVTPSKMAGKIRAVCRARDDIYPSGVVIARTDSFNSKVAGSMEDAVDRGVRYADSGANLLWCEFNQCNHALPAAFAEGVKRHHPDLPLAFNYSPSLPWTKTPVGQRVTFRDLNEMGYKFIFVTIAAFHASTKAVYDYAERFAAAKEAALWEMQDGKVGHTTADHQALMRVNDWQTFEREFDPDATADQAQGEGFKT